MNHTDAVAMDRPVFILGCTFRTGSTFLQRLINSSGEVFIWGENMGIAEDLRVTVAKLASWRAISDGQGGDLEQNRNDAWIANLNPALPHAAEAAARAFFTTYYAQATRQRGCARWGFKEVRCDAGTARFLLQLFPDARIVLLVRQPQDVLASMATSSWYAHAGGGAGVLKAWRSGVEGFLSLQDSRVQLMRLEDFAASPVAALERLGEHIGIDPARIDASILHRPVRGSTSDPALGAAEHAALAEADLDSLMGALGYRPSDGQ
ncbi:MAG: sulfotransferase [Betaproteobacteria bacterium]